MTIMPMETTAQLSPQLVDVVRTTNQLSASERLFLAKVLLATVDALMAAIALRYDLVLLTADNDFNNVPGLNHENWFSNSVPLL